MNKLPFCLFRALLRFILRLIARVEVIGAENLPASGGCVIAANHVGRLDAAMAYYLLDRTDIIMVVAEKYQQYAFFRWLVRLTDGMFIDRHNADIPAIRETLRRLNEGQVFVITPEGTRSKSGTLLEAKAGAIYVAWKAGVPVVPVALTGSEDAVVVSRLKRFKRLRIRAVVGEAFHLPQEGKGPERGVLLQHYTDEVMCRIAALLPKERWGFYADHARLKELIRK